MRIVNPGFRGLFKEYGVNNYQDSYYKDRYANDDNYTATKKKIAEIMSNLGLEHYISPVPATYMYTLSDNTKTLLRTHMDEAKNELWLSFCFFVPSYNDTGDREPRFISLQFVGTGIGMYIGRERSYSGVYKIESAKINEKSYIVNPYYMEQYNVPDNNKLISEPIDVNMSNTPTYVEVHIKTGSEGRIDVWINNALKASYRSPSTITGSITDVNIYSYWSSNSYYSPNILHSFIFQDTGRIGLERLKKLTVSPDTDQTMPQNSTTNFTLSGLSDATEFSDITSIVPIIRTTSKDANITEGTFSIDGATIGTVDVSDSSGKAIASTSSTINSITNAPWTRDNIEGKTLSFKVNGAS